MKALSLDWEPLIGLRECCEKIGIPLTEHQYNQNYVLEHVAEFSKKFKEDLRESELLIATGDFAWLRFFGETYGVYEAFQEAIRSGTQFIFQLPRAWDDNYRVGSEQQNSDCIKRLFKTIGVTPTPYRVFTDDSPSDVGGGAIGSFRSGDNCFLNADVLGDSDTIVLGFVNIISFERGVFPVVETGPLHYLVGQGDLHASLDIGLRPAVFVEVRREEMSGYVIGGRFFSDSYEAVGGPVPGIELNRPAVMSLLRKVLNARRQQTGFEVSTYRDLYDFERSLGDILMARLPAHEAALLKEASLTDLIRTTLDNWKMVGDLFAPMARAEFSKSTSAIPNGVRLFLCHPIKLNFSPNGISELAAHQLRSASLVVRAARGRLTKDN
jgi:hypothetical protein